MFDIVQYCNIVHIVTIVAKPTSIVRYCIQYCNGLNCRWTPGEWRRSPGPQAGVSSCPRRELRASRAGPAGPCLCMPVFQLPVTVLRADSLAAEPISSCTDTSKHQILRLMPHDFFCAMRPMTKPWISHLKLCCLMTYSYILGPLEQMLTDVLCCSGS